MPLQTLRDIDRVCRRLDASLRTGRLARIEDLIAECSDPTSSELLCELIATEVSVLRELGEWPARADYIQRFPESESAVESAFASLQETSSWSRAEGPACGDASDSPASPRIVRIKDFEVIRELGRGGMGVVYEADQTCLNRRVALKVLHIHAARDERLLRRFKQEARATAAACHANIVELYGAGVDGGTPWLAMELVDGPSLGRLWEPDSECRWPTYRSLVDRSSVKRFDTVARVGRDIASALEFAHQRGLLHRDVKPSNILLDKQGKAYLTDFGLARFLDADHSLTLTGEFVGTIRYAAPETFMGECDVRSDVYGLGVTLHELVGLQPPFDENSRLALIDRITRGCPTPWDTTAAAVPRDLGTIIRKAMAVEPGHRYATAGELAADLDRFLHRQPVAARPVNVPERVIRWCQREPLVAGVTGTLMFVLLVCFLAAVLGWRSVGNANDAVRKQRDLALQYRLEAIEARKASESEAAVSREAARLATRRLADLHNARALHWMEAGRLREALAETQAAQVAARRIMTKPSQTGGEDGTDSFVQALSYRAAALAAGLPEPIAQVQVPDSAWSAFQECRLLRTPNRLVPRFSDDGQTILLTTTYRTDAFLWDLASGTLTNALPERCRASTGRNVADGSRPHATRLTADGNLAVLQFGDGRLELWDVPGDRKLQVLERPPESGELTYCCVDAQRRRLVICQQMKQGLAGWVRCWDADNGTLLSDAVSDIRLSFTFACFSPDGRQLVVSHDVTEVWDWQDPSRPAALLAGEQAPLRFSGISQDGTRLLCASLRTVDVWELSAVSQAAPEPKWQMPLPYGMGLHVFDMDKAHRAAVAGDASGRVFVWDVAQLRLRFPPLMHSKARIEHLAIDPAGTNLAVADIHGELRVWSLATGRPTTPVLDFSEPLGGLAWSPDGDHLALTTRSGRAEVLPVAVDRGERLDTGLAMQLSFSPDSSRLLTSTIAGVTEIWDVTKSPPQRLRRLERFPVQSADWSSDGSRLAVLTGIEWIRGTPRIWSWEAQQPDTVSAPLSITNQSRVRFVDEDSRLLVSGRRRWQIVSTADDREPGESHITAAPEGKEITEGALAAHPLNAGGKTHEVVHEFRAAHFSMNRQTLVRVHRDLIAMCLSPTDGELDATLWVHDSQGRLRFEAATPPLMTVDDLAFTSDGKSLVAAGAFGILSWDVATGERHTRVSHAAASAIHLLAPAADAPLLAMCSTDGVCQVLETHTWAQVGESCTLDGKPLWIGLLPKGGTLLVVDRVRGWQLWDVSRGEPMGPLNYPGHRIYRCQLSRDGLRLALSLDDGTTRVFTLPSLRYRGGGGRHSPMMAHPRW